MEPSADADKANIPLSQSINAASKLYHTQLNRLITSRLPFALPPHALDPDIYALGLEHFAPIYMTFETIWSNLTSTESSTELPLSVAVLLSSLIHVNIPELTRTERLLQDLSVLNEESQEHVTARLYAPEGPRIAAFVAHIENAVHAQPHVLIAYAWVMYMALFNGGLWIRAQLTSARDASWELPPPPPSNGLSVSPRDEAENGLSFWFFPGAIDGKEYKHEFKARLVEVERMLTVEQREDIVREAGVIFCHCSALVGELDGIVEAKRRADVEAGGSTVAMWLRWMGFAPLGCLDLFMMVVRFVSRFCTRGPSHDEEQRRAAAGAAKKVQ